MMLFCRLLSVLAVGFVSLASAQTTTFTDGSGNTIVGVITANAQGVSTTQILQTLAPAQPTTTDQGGIGAGPVGQPAATTASAGAPTPYTYTTVINGVTSVLEDIFTPTSPATVSASIPATGTILDFDTWSSLYGPPAPKSEASFLPISLSTLFFTMLMTTLLL